VVEDRFGQKKLFDLITMVETGLVTMANAKQVMMKIVDGDDRKPTEIAKDLGYIGGAHTDQAVIDAVHAVLQRPENVAVIEKIKDGNERPIMSLVGQVMKDVNRTGDPVVIKRLLSEGIDKLKTLIK